MRTDRRTTSGHCEFARRDTHGLRLIAWARGVRTANEFLESLAECYPENKRLVSVDMVSGGRNSFDPDNPSL